MSTSNNTMTSTVSTLAILVAFIPVVVFGHAGEKHDDKGVSIESSVETSEISSLPVDVGGPFSLIDHNGKRVSNDTYLGKHALVFFGYTNCQVMCSISLERIGGALALLEKENADVLTNLAPLVVTVDPNNDYPAQLKSTLNKYHPALTGLTGTQDELNQMYAAYDQSPSKLDIQMNDKDVVTHTSYFYLMGPDGNLQTLFPPILNSESMASILKKYILRPN